jgi:SAM-dependent methyltransferase
MATRGSTLEGWQEYSGRYPAGSYRPILFHDMVRADIETAGKDATVLDIGCGRGFDGDQRVQRSLAEASGRYIGVEPDGLITPGNFFTHVYSSFFEEAPIAPGSVDVAFAVMVLEHLEHPQRFWDKLHEVLADGGVFWGFTIDGRSRFCHASLLAERLRLKDLYLGLLHGKRGTDRYANYPVYYRCNAPEQVLKCAHGFRQCGIASLTCVGQLKYYLPAPLHPLLVRLDKWDLRTNRPGPNLVVRAVK